MHVNRSPAAVIPFPPPPSPPNPPTHAFTHPPTTMRTYLAHPTYYLHTHISHQFTSILAKPHHVNCQYHVQDSSMGSMCRRGTGRSSSAQPNPSRWWRLTASSSVAGAAAPSQLLLLLWRSGPVLAKSRRGDCEKTIWS